MRMKVFLTTTLLLGVTVASASASASKEEAVMTAADDDGSNAPLLSRININNNNNNKRRQSSHRHLLYVNIIGYTPATQVTDHLAIDLDQASLSQQLALQTTESFSNAQRIYNEGGHSKSYAQLTLNTPLMEYISKGTAIVGLNSDGGKVRGSAYTDYNIGETVIRVLYETSDEQDNHVGCQVGGLPTNVMKVEGCFAAAQEITIVNTESGSNDNDAGSPSYPYTYDVMMDNRNGRTIAGFSTMADDQMLYGCRGCPYRDFRMFFEYYGTASYADQWIRAAFDGTATNFARGNTNVSTYSLLGRGEIIQKGTVILNIFMYVIRQMENALDDCFAGSLDESVHSLDVAVAYYAGSLEGEDGMGEGNLLYALADKRCINFKTCGIDGGETSGQSKMNYDIIDLFWLVKSQLSSGNCNAAREVVERISNLMYVPLVQSTLRYAFKLDSVSPRNEKDEAAGAIFVAAVLPRIHNANPQAAEEMYNNMRVGSGLTDSTAVKSAFESVYGAMGILCSDVGGLWNEAKDIYYVNMEPCMDDVDGITSPSPLGTSAASSNSTTPATVDTSAPNSNFVPTTAAPNATPPPTIQATPLLSASMRTLSPTFSITRPPSMDDEGQTPTPTIQATPLLSASMRTLAPTYSITRPPTMEVEWPFIPDHELNDGVGPINVPIPCTEDDASVLNDIPCFALFRNSSCRELDVDSEALEYYLYNHELTQNNTQQLQPQYNATSEQSKLFVGPYCSSNGTSVYLGTFMDENCSNHAPTGMYEALAYGMALPYSETSTIHEGGQNLNNQSNVLEVCDERLQPDSAPTEQVPDSPTTSGNTAFSSVPSAQPSMGPSLSTIPSSNFTFNTTANPSELLFPEPLYSVPSSSPSSTAPAQLTSPEPNLDYTNSGQYDGVPLWQVLLTTVPFVIFWCR